jgi:two-component system, NtrC family, C4-dicarboxylate transport response regulator DctD
MDSVERAAATFIGRSPPIERLRVAIESLANAPVNVLITGESGTGKELVARAIHAQADPTASFAVIDCPSLSDGGAEEAFIRLHEGLRPSTPAGRDPHRPMLFVKTVEHLGPLAQALLSRIVRSQSETGGLPKPIRVIASARQDLGAMCKAGAFLPDLYYGLSVFHLKTVPLRAMREDIALLLETFLAEAAARHGREVPNFDGAMPRLLSHVWPGNVRELRNFALRLVLGLNEDGSAREDEVGPLPLAEQVSRFEKEIIVQQLRRHRGNVGAASEVLAVPKTTLYEKLQKFGISSNAFKGREAYGSVRGLGEA